MKIFGFILALLLFFWTTGISSAVGIDGPKEILQGEPLMVTISGPKPATITFDGTAYTPFEYQGAWRALVGIDLYKKPGEYALSVTHTDGFIEKQTITVTKRQMYTAPLGIPEKLGGNTPAAATKLVGNLAKENALLSGLRTGTHAFWKEAFRFPLAEHVVTDDYGYSRQTVGNSIAHKGTDFRAAEGSRVMAMNRGVVRFARTTSVYGKAIVVDHGLGLQTLYLHLSKIYVNEGELVLPGQTIGLSGSTGYAEHPHLHISVKIRGVSIDPMKFLELFKSQNNH